MTGPTKTKDDELIDAWRNWQSEESRDRGYNFELCQKLRSKYLRLKEEHEQTLL